MNYPKMSNSQCQIVFGCGWFVVFWVFQCAHLLSAVVCGVNLVVRCRCRHPTSPLPTPPIDRKTIRALCLFDLNHECDTITPVTWCMVKLFTNFTLERRNFSAEMMNIGWWSMPHLSILKLISNHRNLIADCNLFTSICIASNVYPSAQLWKLNLLLWKEKSRRKNKSQLEIEYYIASLFIILWEKSNCSIHFNFKCQSCNLIRSNIQCVQMARSFEDVFHFQMDDRITHTFSRSLWQVSSWWYAKNSGSDHFISQHLFFISWMSC